MSPYMTYLFSYWSWTWFGSKHIASMFSIRIIFNVYLLLITDKIKASN